MSFSATYSPEDNSLRLYSTTRLDTETYARVKAAGFQWAPKQDLWKASMWTPSREDLLLALCGTIEDEDTSLVERAETRAERFETYSENRTTEADQTRANVQRIMDGIPLGQPLLVNHHSDKHAVKDQERIHNGMSKAVSLWKSAQYWESRAQGVLRHAKYKERPDVRARRIKGLEADLRKQQKEYQEASATLKLWSVPEMPIETARKLASLCHLTVCVIDGSHWSAWDVLRPDEERWQGCPAYTVEQVQACAQEAYPRLMAHCQRWIDHIKMRLAYERTLLAAQGGTIADQTKPEKGGAVRCWVGGKGEWLTGLKVNKVSVTIGDGALYGGKVYPRTIAFDKLGGIMTKADVDAKREAGV